MKFRYMVKFNGKYYPAGTEVPTGDIENKPVETPVVETESEYTKTEINRMNVDKLKELAQSVGIEVTEESTGKQLKEALIEHYGLQ